MWYTEIAQKIYQKDFMKKIVILVASISFYSYAAKPKCCTSKPLKLTTSYTDAAQRYAKESNTCLSKLHNVVTARKARKLRQRVTHLSKAINVQDSPDQILPNLSPGGKIMTVALSAFAGLWQLYLPISYGGYDISNASRFGAWAGGTAYFLPIIAISAHHWWQIHQIQKTIQQALVAPEGGGQELP